MFELLQSARGASTRFPRDSFSTGPLTPRALITPSSCTEVWRPLIDELLRIRMFQDNWDGQDAVGPSNAIVDTAISLAMRFQRDEFPPADRVVAGPSGTVYFEWHSPRIYMEVEITSPGIKEVREVVDGVASEYFIQ